MRIDYWFTKVQGCKRTVPSLSSSLEEQQAPIYMHHLSIYNRVWVQIITRLQCLRHQWVSGKHFFRVCHDGMHCEPQDSYNKEEPRVGYQKLTVEYFPILGLK